MVNLKTIDTIVNAGEDIKMKINDTKRTPICYAVGLRNKELIYQLNHQEGILIHYSNFSLEEETMKALSFNLSRTRFRIINTSVQNL